MSSPGQAQRSLSQTNPEGNKTQTSVNTGELVSTNSAEKKEVLQNSTTTHRTLDNMANPQKKHKEDQDKDPFTTPSVKVRSEQKLSATASAFQPFMYRTPVASSAFYAENVASSPKPFNFQVEDKTSAEPTNSLNSAGGSGYMGAFSTATRVTRAIRIAGIYSPVASELVESCISEKGIPDRATRQFYHSASEVLVRFSDVQDAVMMYNYAKLTHPEWAVDYISPAVCAEVGRYVVLYFATNSLLEDKFERLLRLLLRRTSLRCRQASKRRERGHWKC